VSQVSDGEARRVLALVREELLRLARQEDELAAVEAGCVPYWASCPATVPGHRRAAAALRADAEVVGAGAGFQVMWIGGDGSPAPISMIEWDSPHGTGTSPVQPLSPRHDGDGAGE
jgi:hypothetical protein